MLAIISGLAVAVVVHVGTQRSSAQTAALAALRSAPGTLHNLQTLAASQPSSGGASGHTVTVVEAPAPASGGGSDSGGSSDSGGADDTSTAAAPAVTTTASTPTTTHTTATATTTATTTTTPTDAGLPKVGHVFVIELSDTGYDQAFGTASQAAYLRSLVAQGTVLSNYRSLGHGELADALATTIGQPPNADTTQGCSTFSAFTTGAQPNGAGVLAGDGCLFPDSVASLADKVGTSGRRWSAFVSGLDQSTCASPQVDGPLNAKLQGVSAAYDPAHNPFIFFQSLVEAGGCASSDVDITKLANELKTTSLTPTYSYLAPDACADGSLAPVGGTATATTTTPSTGTTVTGTTAAATTATGTTAVTTPTAAPGAVTTGVCAAGATAGIPAEDAFLAQWVPQILASPAYQANGVLIIAFNGNRPAHGTGAFSTGALVLSKWTKPDQVLRTHYTPYGLLRSVENMLNLQPLGESARATAFAKQVLPGH